MAKLTTEEIVSQLTEKFGETITTNNLKEFSDECSLSLVTLNKRLKEYKTGRGKYTLSVTSTDHTPVIEEVEEHVTLVPEQDPLYIPFGSFKDVSSIIKSKIFFPVFITGLSGNGKTQTVEQACAKLKREMVRVNITIETDEDDLLGGFRLVDGNTAWHNGPVIEALERGAVLLLDEIDLASNKILCLQSVLEGKGVFLKKIGRYVKPAPGFQVIATANTKGRGSDTGKFIGTNVLNEAFLERFAVTYEQEYPTPSIEKKILLHYFGSLGRYDVEKLVNDLTTWAEIIRKTYDDGGIEDVISTRRLIAIVRAYCIWDDIHKAILLTTNRFDDDTSKVFRDLFEKVSGDVVQLEQPTEATSNDSNY